MEYTENIIQAVWEKARGIPNWDNNQWRMDQCGAWIQRQHYNNENSEYGWTIRSIAPGKANQQDNLQPFHWKNTYNIANHKPLCWATADRSGLSPNQKESEPRNNLDYIRLD